MLQREGLEENLRFLILEVTRQVGRTRAFMRTRDEDLLDEIQERDDYIDNLRGIIQRKCFGAAARAAESDPASVERLRAVDVIASNLERIADFCENVIRQVGYLESAGALSGLLETDAFFEEVLAGLKPVEVAVTKFDVQRALRICRAEDRLDRLYAQTFAHLLGVLGQNRPAHPAVTALLIAHYFERMGDSLLNVGEAIISASLGERIKIDQFRALEDTLGAADLAQRIDEIAIEPAGETRSGCRIDRVMRRRPGKDERLVIFKDGKTRKLDEERRSIEQWERLMPGLTPRIFAYHHHGDNGAILFEFLPGDTFETLLLEADQAAVDQALGWIAATLREIWTTTRQDEPVHARFTSQLQRRLDEVYQVHPKYERLGGTIGDLEVPGFRDLVARVAAIEDQAPAPFSVFIHGDFNVDNVICDRNEHRVRFIDLHRSRQMDYVQDVSVFLVSNYRLQVFDAPVRARLQQVMVAFYRFASAFAAAAGDDTFDLRLALGVARSYATSTRFVLSRDHADAMFLRARYLLERVAAANDPAAFRFPEEVLHE